MKLIQSKAEYLPQEEGLDGVYKQIERCARTCYKSEDKITSISAKGFIDRLFKSKHTAMYEHGTIYLKALTEADTDDPEYIKQMELRHEKNPYSVVTYDAAFTYITTNLRVIIQHGWFKDLIYICEPTEFHDKRYTFKFTCSRSIANELVRHRVFSFAQESTRFCNYSKGKFGGEITFVEPSFVDDSLEFKTSEAYNNAYEVFCSSCEEAEGLYMLLIDEGFTAQQARDILPLSLKTELCMTGFASDWNYLLDLRLLGKTGTPHPDMVLLMDKLKTVAEEAGIWNDLVKNQSDYKKLYDIKNNTI